MANVRIIQPQSEKVREVTGSEAEELLRKYGHSGEQNKQVTTRVPDTSNIGNLTFEEAIKLHEEEQAALKARKQTNKPISFESEQGYDKEIKNISTDGVNFKVEITTDMKLPKY